MSAEEPPVLKGRVAPALRAEFPEFPGLRLHYSVVPGHQGRTPSGVKKHLRYLADRMHGRRALGLRREPIASAYRVFFRHIGLDPDEFRIPQEAAVLERLRAGGFKSHGLVEDAITIATVETGVAMRAFDVARVTGDLGLRLAEPRERLGGKDGMELPDGTLVVADEQQPLGLIFGETAADYQVTRQTERVAVCAVQVDGVPDISIEEAIWSCVGVLREARVDD
jgi:DNA/RNA-binding domain of Phe-tRNA-synthetase-like protein